MDIEKYIYVEFAIMLKLLEGIGQEATTAILGSNRKYVFRFERDMLLFCFEGFFRTILNDIDVVLFLAI